MGKWWLSFPLLAIIVSIVLSSAYAQQQGEDQLAPGLVNPGYVDKPQWFKDSFLDIREDIQEAAADNKRVLLYFYQDGCPYCARLLNENLSQKNIVDSMRERFDVIAINMWGDREVTGIDGEETTEKKFAVAHRVMFTPTLLFLDEQGNHVLRLNGYYPPHKLKVALDYAGLGKEREGSYRDYLANTSPAPGSGKLHESNDYLQAPYDLAARKQDRPLLVLFEQKQCPSCDELHDDILQQPGSQALMKKYDVLLLDMWASTPLTLPGGEQSTAAKWAKALKVSYAPSMVFIDAAGNEVFRTEGWLRTFHVQSALDYVASGSYLQQQEFQRFIESRADALRAKGVDVDLMK